MTNTPAIIQIPAFSVAGIAVLLVEQYLDFCRELADEVNIMDRGQIVHTGPAEDLDRADVRKFLTV